MKKLDKLLFRSFIPPLVLAFGVVMFVFTMQSLYKYIDDIIGKGASTGMIIEFILYLSVKLIPLALPAATLLASLFLMGGFAERYELNSMKSAGVSFQRIIRPLIAATLLVGLFSFICANNIVPVAHLKFRTLLQDFKNQKLALSLSEGVFNDDFQNFSIRVGKNNEKTGVIEDIMLYDHTENRIDRTKIVLAKRGKTDTQSDHRYMIMTLEEGSQYQEMEDDAIGTQEPRRYPFLRTRFKKLDKYLNMDEFEMDNMSERVFENDSRSMSIRQLWNEKDTLLSRIDERMLKVAKIPEPYLFFVKKSDSTSYYLPVDELRTKVSTTVLPSAKQKQVSDKKLPALKKKNTLQKSTKSSSSYQAKRENNKRLSKQNEKHDSLQLMGQPSQFVDVFKTNYRNTVIARAEAVAGSIKGKLSSNTSRVKQYNKKIFLFDYQTNLKFSLAIACVVFLLIGAPLGAIIRKGGFGYPVLIGVIFFVLFVVMVTVCQKLGESGSLPTAWLAAWLPVFIFVIPCFFLTRAALRDAQPISGAAVSSFFKRLAFWKK